METIYGIINLIKEDAHMIYTEGENKIFGIFDGHGGINTVK
jgi:serine/threonine protein phosphatase PrpC